MELYSFLHSNGYGPSPKHRVLTVSHFSLNYDYVTLTVSYLIITHIITDFDYFELLLLSTTDISTLL
jgi:hypothetical protein